MWFWVEIRYPTSPIWCRLFPDDMLRCSVDLAIFMASQTFAKIRLDVVVERLDSYKLKHRTWMQKSFVDNRSWRFQAVPWQLLRQVGTLCTFWTGRFKLVFRDVLGFEIARMMGTGHRKPSGTNAFGWNVVAMGKCHFFGVFSCFCALHFSPFFRLNTWTFWLLWVSLMVVLIMQKQTRWLRVPSLFDGQISSVTLFICITK